MIKMICYARFCYKDDEDSSNFYKTYKKNY